MAFSAFCFVKKHFPLTGEMFFYLRFATYAAPQALSSAIAP